MSVVEIIKKKFVLVSGAAVVFVGFGLAGYYSYGGDKKKTQVQASLATASFMTSRGGKKTDTMYSAAASLRSLRKKSRSQIDSKSGKGGNGEICLERGEIFVVEGLTSPITGPADIFNPPCGSMNPEPENCTYFYEPFFMQNGGSESSFVFTDEIGGGELCGGKTDSAAARDKFSFIYVGMEDGELYDAFICSSCFSYGRPSPSALVENQAHKTCLTYRWATSNRSRTISTSIPVPLPPCRTCAPSSSTSTSTSDRIPLEPTSTIATWPSVRRAEG